jgi:hypothetical protein
MGAVPVASLRRKPNTLSFDQAALVGVNYMACRRLSGPALFWRELPERVT